MAADGERKTRRPTRAEVLVVVLLVSAYFAFGKFGGTIVLRGIYLYSAVGNCGPSLGIRTWLYQDLVHETRTCEYGCGSGMRALCRATERGYRIDHDVLVN